MAIGVANVSSFQAAHYYEKDDYYDQELSQDKDSNLFTPQWYGKGAERLGLKGAIESHDFQTVLEGYAPDGRRLQAQPIDPAIHRAGTDYTFGAPKSVSVAALVQGDDRLIEAHHQAVQSSLDLMQDRYIQVRVRNAQTGERDRVCTGNLTAATFTHQTSRNLDPQLHDHAVVLNTTHHKYRYRAVSNEGAVQNQKLLDQVYLNDLAYGARQLGYEIEPRSQSRFELKGYSPETLKVFSTRRQEIEAAVKASGEPETGKLFQKMTIETRVKKRVLSHDEKREHWQAKIDQLGLQLPPLPNQAKELEPQQAEQLIQPHIEKLTQQEGAFSREQLERSILEDAPGQCRFKDIASAIDASPQLVQYGDRLTTPQQLQQLNDLETLLGLNHAQNEPRQTKEARSIDDAQSITPGLRERVAERLAAALGRDSRTEGDDFQRVPAAAAAHQRTGNYSEQIDRCLEQLNQPTPEPRINVEAVARGVAGLRERQTRDWSRSQIAATLESLGSNLEQFERVSSELDRLVEDYRDRLSQVSQREADPTPQQSTRHDPGSMEWHRAQFLLQTSLDALQQADRARGEDEAYEYGCEASGEVWVKRKADQQEIAVGRYGDGWDIAKAKVSFEDWAAFVTRQQQELDQAAEQETEIEQERQKPQRKITPSRSTEQDYGR